MLFNDVHPLKAPKQIVLIDEEIVISFNDEQFSNAYFSISVTVDGIVTVSKLAQLLKANLPIEDTDSGIANCVNLLQFWKHLGMI